MVTTDELVPKWLFVSVLDAFDFRRFLDDRLMSQFRIIANVVNFKIKIWFLWFLVRSELDDNVKLTKYDESFTINFSANITNIRACSCKKLINTQILIITLSLGGAIKTCHVQDMSMSHTYEVQIREGSRKLWAFKLEFEKKFEFTNTYWHSSEVKWKKRELRELNKLTR